jgi:hypothetical protein
MKKLTVALAVSLSLMLFPLAVHAQAAGSFQVLSVDLGLAPQFGAISSGNLGTSYPLLGVNVRFANNLSAGAEILIQGTTVAANYLTLKYTIVPTVRAVLVFGAFQFPGAATTAGLGFEVNPYTRAIGGSGVAEVKFCLKYVTSVTSLTTNTLMFSIALGAGL